MDSCVAESWKIWTDMDVKSTFLNGELEEEFYIEKLVPRAWYSRLDKYLQQAGFRKGSANNNLYIKEVKTNTRPDICFVVNTLSQFLVEPRRVHLVAAKHVMRYLKGTMENDDAADEENFRWLVNVLDNCSRWYWRYYPRDATDDADLSRLYMLMKIDEEYPSC